MSITNVAVVGGSGDLGLVVVRELVAAGFKVTGVTRASSSATFPDGVAVKRIDYESPGSIREAFLDQHAVVSTIATNAADQQKALVDAAVAAGVRRFVPSEFGIHTRDTRDKPIGRLFGSKLAVVDYLIAKHAENPSFTWTGIATGAFFDWAMKKGLLGIDLANKKAVVVDSGNQKWQASTLAHIGRAVAAVLRRPDETANRYISTASFNVSANEIIAAAEKASGGAKFTITKVDSDAIAKAGDEKLANGDFSGFIDLLMVYNAADNKGLGYLDPKKSANEELGLPWEKVDDVVAELVRGI
jgi:nucleoside-diphosphate-sugar epimerase